MVFRLFFLLKKDRLTGKMGSGLDLGQIRHDLLNILP